MSQQLTNRSPLKRFFIFLLPLFAVFSLCVPAGLNAAPKKRPPLLTVAVASNALRPVKEIVRLFEKKHSVPVRLASGSTGKLYTQIIQGAPFDVFLAADSERPELLEKKGSIIKEGSRFTYATGALAVWGRKGKLPGSFDLTYLADPSIKRIAIANPKTAPYGAATIEALKATGILEKIEKKFIYGENVSQTFNFAKTGNTDVAIVSVSTVYKQSGKSFKIDTKLHSPVMQQAVILKAAPKEAALFADFLKSGEAIKVFKKYGYVTN